MNILYDNLRERLLTAQFNWLTADVRAAFVSETYVASPSDLSLAQLPANSILHRTESLTGKTATAGYARGIPPEIRRFRNPTPVGGVLLFEHNDDDALTRLISYSNDGPAVPFEGVGFDYVLAYNSDKGGFFRA